MLTDARRRKVENSLEINMAASSAVGSSSRALAHVMASTQAPGPGGSAPSGVATAQAPVPEQVHLPPAAKRNANGPDAEVTEAALSSQACLLVVVGANSRVVLRMLLARAFRSCGTPANFAAAGFGAAPCPRHVPWTTTRH